MKAKLLMRNTLFGINLGMVVFLSIGAGYFTLVPLLMFERDLFTVARMVTQNAAMVGLWIIYFVSIICLPISGMIWRKK